MLWTELKPEPGLLFALEHAGPRPETGSQNEKRGWSERLANACAVALADELRRVPILRGKRIRPADLKTGTEGGYPAGIVRFLNVAEAPPFRGRPIVESTRGLKDLVDDIVGQAISQDRIDWAHPEAD